jgi:iron complex outermembrane receptor protein
MSSSSCLWLSAPRRGAQPRDRRSSAIGGDRERARALVATALVLGFLPGVVLAQSAASGDATRLAPVVVTATRTEASPFDVPASIDVVGGDAVRDSRRQIDISESLGGVPGLLARDRENYAQDVQISVRGFGARASFGLRGVRVYVDGIPATMPDGQGQITNVDLGSADRIEVLRGPFSALYGNSSGGVIQVFTEEGSGPPTVTVGGIGASWGTYRVGVKVRGSSGSFGYLVSASSFATDGYRQHSAAQREIANAKLTWRPDDASKLTLVINSVALPKAQDELGLSRAELEANPRGVDPTASTFNTRKTIDQTQLGVVYERRIDAVNSIRALVYDGHRSTQQFQAIPVATQANPLSPGGVIALANDYSGTDLRWTVRTRLNDRPFTLIAGVAYDALDELRLGYQNFIGTMLGVQGALRRNENDKVSNFDQYVQTSWRFAERWSLDAGLRRSSIRFESIDHYVVGTNPNDSGGVDYGANLPVAGLMYAVNETVHLYATAGRGFETPTLNELAYRPNGLTGLNLGLQAASSDSVEAGMKARSDTWGDLSLALFRTGTQHEIVTQTNIGGRSTYQNAGATRRQGLEAAWTRSWQENLRAQVAYTWLDARYHDSFTTCTVTPCATPNLTIPAGSNIPGLARSSLYAALAWAPPQGWRAGVEGRALTRVWVNDANSDAAPGYAIASANLGYLARVGAWNISGFSRVDNLFGRHYVGSVIVNEGNSRYFEPAPVRSWTVGLAATTGF